jgi:hypothetical protein
MKSLFPIPRLPPRNTDVLRQFLTVDALLPLRRVSIVGHINDKKQIEYEDVEKNDGKYPIRETL